MGDLVVTSRVWNQHAAGCRERKSDRGCSEEARRKVCAGVGRWFLDLEAGNNWSGTRGRTVSLYSINHHTQIACNG